MNYYGRDELGKTGKRVWDEFAESLKQYEDHRIIAMYEAADRDEKSTLETLVLTGRETDKFLLKVRRDILELECKARGIDLGISS